MRITNSTSPIDIAVSGIRAQNKSIEVISSNVANSRTLDAGNGQPYRKLDAMLRVDDSNGDGIGGVQIEDLLPSQSDFPRVLDPGNPKADAQGYISMPNVDIPTEMMNLNIASRAYQANAAVLKRYQNMVEVSLELLR
ncbi:MAG: flagellar basal body rod protein FlgC [Sedimentisphaerales bacterium]|nr:flagellar basal body rod protein FlgC [Sedimentisphaerales bacterium]